MNNTIKTMDLSELSGKLRREDSRYTRMVGGFKYFAWVMLAVLGAAFTWDVVREGWNVEGLSSLLLLLAYVCLAYIFTSYHKDFRSIDYAEPTYRMLQKAAYRYRLLHGRSWFVLLALLLLDVSTSLRFMDIKSFDMFQWPSFAKIHFIVAPIWLASIGIGVLKWYFSQKPLRDGALKLLEEMDME